MNYTPYKKDENVSANRLSEDFVEGILYPSCENEAFQNEIKSIIKTNELDAVPQFEIVLWNGQKFLMLFVKLNT